MRLVKVRFLSGLNLLAPESGALVHLDQIDPSANLDPAAVVAWIQGAPILLSLTAAELPKTLRDLIPRLLWALTEMGRLFPAPTRVVSEAEDALHVWVPVDDKQAAQEAARFLCLWVNGVCAGGSLSPPDLAVLQRLLSRSWNQTHAHLARAAKELDVPFCRLDLVGQQFLQLGQGHRLRLLHETLSDRTTQFSRAFTGKVQLHAVLASRGIPLPAQRVARSVNEALEAAESIGWPVVLKPTNGGKGKGVWVGLSNPDALRRAWQANGGEVASPQIVQEVISGEDHRLLVSGGRLLAVALRRPAEVTGDGIHTVAELVAALNADPRRGLGYERLMNRVPVDGRMAEVLSQQGLDLQAIPDTGQRIRVSRTANISQGGSAIDRTDHVHPDNRTLAEDVALLLGTETVGIDLLSTDISRSWREGGAWLLETNLSPGLRPHLIAESTDRLCRELVQQWTGGGEASRVPTVGVTGSVGKTTTCLMLHHLLTAQGHRVATGTTMGAFFDEEPIAKGDCASGRAASRLLQDRRVTALASEIARGSIIQVGTALESLDVAVITSVFANHIGMDGIRSRHDLLQIKSLIAALARRAVVIDGDDPQLLAEVRRRTTRPLTLVSRFPGSQAWQDHRRQGGWAVRYGCGRQGRLEAFHGDALALECAAAAVGASHGGIARGVVASAAFAAIVALHLGVSPEVIVTALASFGSSPHHQQGRYERVIDGETAVFLVWADGPEATASLAEFAVQLRGDAEQGRRLLLLICPDSRPEEYAFRMGAATAGFDAVVCGPWDHPRKRPEDRIQRALAAGAQSAGIPADAVRVTSSELEALQVLRAITRPGDLVLVCSFDPVARREQIHELFADL